MKDANAAIRMGIVNALENVGVPVYDELLPANRSAYKYILITSQTQGGERTKERFMPVCTAVLDITVRTRVQRGKLECDEIVNDVLTLINPLRRADYIDLGDDFELINTSVIQNDTQYFMSGTEHVYRRLVRVQFKVIERVI